MTLSDQPDLPIRMSISRFSRAMNVLTSFGSVPVTCVPSLYSFREVLSVPPSQVPVSWCQLPSQIPMSASFLMVIHADSLWS